MFTNEITKNILENALFCQKNDTFKYVDLSNSDIEQFAAKFLEEKPDRISCINKDDVYSFLDYNLKAIGYKSTRDGVFIFPKALSDCNYFLEYFNNWLRANPNANYLIPHCHITNLELLESLIGLFQFKLEKTLLERLSLDLEAIIADPSYKNYEQHYEHFILSLLSECSTGYIFSNILRASNNDSFKEKVFEVISSSANRGPISLEVVSNLGVNHVPPSMINSYIEFVNPSSVSLDTFIGILNVVPISNFTVSNLDPNNPVFNKYVAFIKHYIETNNVSEELISKMIQAASPYNSNGWVILDLLNRACASYSARKVTNTPMETSSRNIQHNEYFALDEDIIEPIYGQKYVSNDTTEEFVNNYNQFPIGENLNEFSNTNKLEEFSVDNLPF